ncbi:MAG: PAS domain S-box protein [Gemmatimonadaceae bacterium]|nr:PAS domain S-box protein [Gemmatimonadaceae bacterium]
MMREPTTLNLHLLIARIRDYAILTLSPVGIITSWNPGAVTIKGYTAEEAIGQHFSILYREEDAKRGIPDHNLRIAEAEGIFRDPEGIRRRKNGELFTAEVEIVSLVENGVLLGFAKIVRDVTERIRMRDDLRKATSSWVVTAQR